jgi:hypothetical protein
MPTPRRAVFVLALALSASAVLLGAAAPDAMRFGKLNRTYADFVPAFEEYVQGGIRVRLSSPKQALVLRDNRVRLTPEAGGLFAGAVELDVQGKGTLVADLDFGPLAERLTEEVIVPPQTIQVAGKVRLRRVAGGYEIVPVELPASIAVAIQSPRVNTILTLCDQAALLSLGSIQCAGLDRAMTRPSIPLPSGQSFTLHDADLDDADRRELDALLPPAPPASAPN